MVLGLFMTRGMTINEWINRGLISRELLIYKYLLDKLIIDKLYIYTYDTKSDSIVDVINDKRIKVIFMPYLFSFPFLSNFYMLLLPFIHFNFICLFQWKYGQIRFILIFEGFGEVSKSV